MMTGILIALAAGLASATMFASVASGAMLAFVLFYLAPLPLIVAALGWGSITALIGGIVAAIGLGAAFGLPYMAAFALTVALPAWWLGHLTLLARPVSDDPQLAQLSPSLDWYPTGRLLLWSVAFASLTTISALFTLGTDEPTITGALRRALQRILAGSDLPSGDNDRLVDALVAIAPGAATAITLVTLTLNLWLAAKVTGMSGRLKRPWPDLRMTTLPKGTLAAVVAAIVLSFVGGLTSLLAQIASAALLMAYAITGFAVLHVVTQSFSSRAILLGAAYAATLFVGWPLLAMIGIGLADAVFGIRRTFLAKRGPPPTLIA